MVLSKSALPLSTPSTSARLSTVRRCVACGTATDRIGRIGRRRTADPGFFLSPRRPSL